MRIHRLKHDEIDFLKWDDRVEKSRNGLVYAFSWFLNVVSPGWEALVSDDYEYIMPLPVKRKFGLKFLIQPILTQQLGIFSDRKIDETVVNSFIKKIPFWSYRLNLNENNFTSKAIEQPNYILDLQADNEQLLRNFSKNTKRNISHAKKQQLIIDNQIGVQEFSDAYFRESQSLTFRIKDRLVRLIEVLAQRNLLTFWGCRTADGELISAVGLLKWRNRLIYLLPFSNAKGKEYSAMFLTISKLIETYANSPFVLDFEGSRIEGIARFFKGFGAIHTPYYSVQRFSIDALFKLRKKV